MKDFGAHLRNQPYFDVVFEIEQLAVIAQEIRKAHKASDTKAIVRELHYAMLALSKIGHWHNIDVTEIADQRFPKYNPLDNR